MNINNIEASKLTNILFGKTDDHIHWFSPTIGLNKEVVSAFNNMKNKAKQDGIDLAIASGFRDFNRQCTIWTNKFTGKTTTNDINNNIVDISHYTDFNKIKAIMLFSAIPGLSRHHWGTDIDVYSPNSLTQEQTLKLEYWEYEENGPMFALKQWLNNNANQFGFYFPYKSYNNGVASEPWHLSFYPLAIKYQDKVTKALYSQFLQTNKKEISGFEVINNNLTFIFETFINNINYPSIEGNTPNG